PKWTVGKPFRIASTKPFADLAEAKALGISANPVLIGPFSLVLLGKPLEAGVDVLGETLPSLVVAYGEVIEQLAAAGAEWIQLDEPTLVQDRTPQELAAFRAAYETLAAKRGQAKLIVQTYFSHVGTSYASLSALPVAGIGLDFVRGRTENLALLRQYGFPEDKLLVAGVVDGRNVWRSDLEKVLALTEEVAATVPSDRLLIAPSSSLL